jgi:hypothetical protein
MNYINLSLIVQMMKSPRSSLAWCLVRATVCFQVGALNAVPSVQEECCALKYHKVKIARRDYLIPSNISIML